MGSITPEAQVRTFKHRRGRMGARHADALTRLWPRYGVELPTGPTSPNAFFARRAPVVLEIGSGMGEGTLAIAAADPDRNYLAVEVHTPGVANLLAIAEAADVGNLRVAIADAMEFTRLLQPGSLSAIHIFFPDPWPKARHRKRRLLQRHHLALLHSRLAIGGTLHCATDWAEYAHEALAALTAEPAWTNPFDGFAPRPAWRPVTKFEQRGRDAGRNIFDLMAVRAS